MMLATRQSTQSPAAATPQADNRQAPVLLRAEGLKKRFGGQVVLDGVDLELRRGEVVLLRGENGSGKTTLLNILTGNLEPDAGAIHYLADDSPRTYRFPRRWWQELNPFDHFTPEFVAREGVCRTWQEIRLFNSQTLRDNIAVAEPGHPGENPLIALMAPSHAAHREQQLNHDASAILAKLGLEGREASSADKISLGQSKRVAIARAVAAGARILFLDEPLAGLDHQGISDIIALLRALVNQHQVTLVIVEHIFNQTHLYDLVTTHWLLKQGAIRRSELNGDLGGNEDLHAVVHAEAGGSRPKWLSLFVGVNEEITDELLPKGGLLMRIRHKEQLTGPSAPLLDIRNLVVNRGSRVVIGLDDPGSLSGFNLTLHHGEVAILFAPNGWGKSSLFAAISGLIPTESGSIVLDGKQLDGLTVSERFHVGLRALPSDNHVFPNLHAREVMKLAKNTCGQKTIEGLRNRVCSSLSGGERKKVALAAMIGGTVGIYDEPFSALDEFNTMQFPMLGSAGGVSAQLILVPGSH